MANECTCCQPPWQFQSDNGAVKVSVRKFNSHNPPVQQWRTNNIVSPHYIEDLSFGSSLLGGCANWVVSIGDVILLAYDTDGAVQWTKTWFDALGGDVHVDSSDNVYNRGEEGSSDSRILKHASSGSLTWFGSQPGNGVFKQGMVVDGSGNVYAGRQVFLEKYASSGGFPLWSNSGASSSLRGLSLDSSGNIYCAIAGTAAGHDTLKKVNSSGTTVWEETGSSLLGSTLKSLDVAVDSSDGIYLVGLDGVDDGYLIKVNTDGDLVWNKSFSGQAIRAVAVNGNDEICIVGQTDGSSDAKLYDSAGTQIWSRLLHNRLGNASDESLYAVDFDGSNNLYVGGVIVTEAG